MNRPKTLEERIAQRITRSKGEVFLRKDFADLLLVVISERLDISKIVTLDSDFDAYRRYRTSSKPFERILWPRS